MAATWLAVMVATAASAPRRRGTSPKCPTTYWAQELAQAGGGARKRRAGRSDRGKADAESRKRNDAILKWLESNDVWVSELSGWSRHPPALSNINFDELEGEDSWKGTLRRRPQDAILALLFGYA